ncbi:hypothetical protein CALVIDRAFT_140158 [Calocera viscosa TUFC12733]|uniref:Pentacotripeptide-repeat region of PRORP domain-containing protein n=1 Tax=Calocera viscosa (strain TUFC12733) TaxID=1330018 RepID=A0A167M2K8_CALVF|nr:hypothetical protein CALVIDRAFT_140158 [Calocera viscosa TUFC12733]
MSAKRLLHAFPTRTATARVRPASTSSLLGGPAQVVEHSHDDAVRSEIAENYARNGDMSSAWREVRRMGECGVPPHRETIAILLELDTPAHTIEAELDEIDVANKATKATPLTPMGMVSRIWESSIRRILAKPKASAQPAIERALAVYRSAVNKGIKPTSRMALPILRGLCPWSTPERADLDRAMSIYRGLVAAIPASSQIEQIHEHVFSMLLRALVEKRLYEDIKDMCREMRQRKVSIPANQISGHILSVIRSTDTHDEAFDCYRHLRTLAPAEIDYVPIVTVFIYKRTDLSPFPPASSVFTMLAHSIESRNPELDTNTSLVTLLNRYCQNIYWWKKWKFRQEKHPSLPTNIRPQVDEVNAYLRCEYPGTPNTAVWNALLNAYNFTRDFRECFTLWDEMRSNHGACAVDQATVSIMMDTCGQANAGILALRIWEELRGENFPLNKNNWDSHVECLAKLGPAGHDAAMHIVINQMGETESEDGTVPAADLDTLRILLAHSWALQRITTTILRIRKELPNLFDEMFNAAVKSEASDSPQLSSGALLRPDQIFKALPKKYQRPQIPPDVFEPPSEDIPAPT